MFFPLHIVSNWITHTASSLAPGASPSAAHQQTEMRLKQWYGDLFAIWGTQRRPIPPRPVAPEVPAYSSASRSGRTQLPPLSHTGRPAVSEPADRRMRPQERSPLDGSRSEIMLPPARPIATSGRSEPERLPNITPRKLFDLLDEPAQSPRSDRPSGLSPRSAVSGAGEGRPRSPAHESRRASSNMSPILSGRYDEETDSDRERKRRRIETGNVSSGQTERRSEGDDDREDRAMRAERSLRQGSQGSNGMSGLAVLTAAAAASR